MDMPKRTTSEYSRGSYDDSTSVSPSTGAFSPPIESYLSKYAELDVDEESGQYALYSSGTISATPHKPSNLHSTEQISAFDFQRVTISAEKDPHEQVEIVDAATHYLEAINLRRKYSNDWYESQYQRKRDPEDLLTSSTQHIVVENGIFQVYEDESSTTPLFPCPVPNLSEYYKDINTILNTCGHGPCKSNAFKRLSILEAKFNLHKILNAQKEKDQLKEAPHRDFYNVYKVDTHIHMSSAMNQKHLLKFIKRKLRDHPTDAVIIRNGQQLTLSEVFTSLNLNSYQLSVDMLDVHADTQTFHRFDKFNLKYNPIGESRLREIFLKTDNFINGKYLAEIVQELITSLDESKYQRAEWRVSIYGKKRSEWDSLARWVVDNDLFSDSARFLIQVPRLFDIYHETGLMANFQDMLDNIFLPLFEVSRDPSSNPQLHRFLEVCVGIDCVDDESKPEVRLARRFPEPRKWEFNKNPPYSYYLFYLWANLNVLNQFRAAKGLSTLAFRPHSGEAGDIDHLVTAFLLADGISHGINLKRVPVLQYLFYLAQIPIAVSPLSNNSLFVDYSKNPFPVFFARGLNVSLSTDDPLQFHYTREPIIEEYSMAAQVWKFTGSDTCEIARNSVLHSGFPHHLKQDWIGSSYFLPGINGNDMYLTNVPFIRILYRYETLLNEMELLYTSLQNSTVDKTFLVDKLQEAHEHARGSTFVSPLKPDGIQPNLSSQFLL